MAEYHKLCIICCLPFVSSDLSQTHEKISEFCGNIINDVGSYSENGDKERSDSINFREEILELEHHVQMSICCTCFSSLTEWLTYREKMCLLETHVISLQKEIIKGLRDLEKVTEKINYHRETLKKTVEGSDESSLKRALNIEGESNCLAFKLRQYIVKDMQMKKGNLKGNLWILKNYKNVTQERTIIKSEILEEVSVNYDNDDDTSSHSWYATDNIDLDEKHVILTDFKFNNLETNALPTVNLRKFSTMTLRRSWRKLNEDKSDNDSKPILQTNRKLKKRRSTKRPKKPVLKKGKIIPHIQIIEPPPKIIYCQNCSFCCTSRQTYLLHLNRHKSKITSGIFSCDICSEQFSMTNDLLKHLHDKHEGSVEKWPCDFPNCDKVLVSRNALVTHKWGHSREKIFKCLACDKKFASKLLLESHSRIHSDAKAFGCDLCDKRFRSRANLIGHQRRDHGAAKLKCKICEMEFCHWSALSSHRRVVHGIGKEKFSCEICGNSFKQKKLLENHLLAHGKDYTFTCEQCGKGFKTGNGLHLHMKMHGGEKNWKCEFCGKEFLRKENLRDHLRVHTGERPFICEICGKDFTQASTLKNHKKKQH